jgi:NAD-dependent dihydropyrimidine dehydrogenase PreA subunit
MAKRLTVVISQGQSNNPVKRKLEETVVAELMMTDGIDVLVIPHLYDLPPDNSAILALQNLPGDFVLLSWLYARAAHWILDRHDIRGRLGETAFKSAWDERKKKWEKQTKEFRPDENTPRVLDERPLPDRNIYHIDLRMEEDAQAFLKEIHRLAAERQTHVVSLDGGLNGSQLASPPQTTAQPAAPTVIPEKSSRRWYPVIDYSRCTNCMECIDFCLFGVYGVDYGETILVEQPDNCRKGCPACSRVCPENAIIFPQHKTPAIAGDPNIGSEMKIDLSQLFGKPNDLDTAARERDEQLRLAGLAPAAAPTAVEPAAEKDELDELIDELDDLDL